MIQKGLFRHSVATKISMVFVPAAIVITVLACAVMLAQLTQLYRANHQDRLQGDLGSAQFFLDSYFSDIKRSAKIIAESSALVNAVKEEDPVVASLALKKVLQAEGIEYGFILSDEGQKVFGRSHNPLANFAAESDPFQTLWKQNPDLQRAATGPNAFITVFDAALRKAERPDLKNPGEDLVYLVVTPIEAFGETIATMVIGKEIGSDPLLQKRLDTIMYMSGSQKKAFALVAGGRFFQKLGAFHPDEAQETMRAAATGESKGHLQLNDSRFDYIRMPFASQTSVQILAAADQSDLAATTNRSIGMTAAIVLLSILMLIGISQVFLKRVMQPLVDISNAAAATARGRFTKVQTLSGHDELSDLSQSYNNMVTELESNTRNLTSLLELGRLISSQNSVAPLAEAIASSARSLIHQQVRVDIAFKHTLFDDHSLRDGFYSVDSARKKENFVVPSGNDDVRIGIYSLTGNVLVADIYLWHAEADVLKRGQLLFQTLGVNVASAIDSIQLVRTMEVVIHKTREIETIFDNITQGICQIDGSCRIVGEYSQYLEKILGMDKLDQRTLFETLFLRSNCSGDEISSVRSIVNSCVGEDAINFLANRHHLPREIQRFVRNENRILELDWSALTDTSDMVWGIMLTVRDVTLLRQLREETETQGKELQKLMCILAVPHSKVADALREAKRYIDRCEQLLGDPLSAVAMAEIKRHLHTLKGLSRALDWKDASETIHNAEDRIVGIFADGRDQFSEQAEAIARKCVRGVLAVFAEYQTAFKKYLSNATQSAQFDPLFEQIISFCDFAIKHPLDVRRQNLGELANLVISARNPRVSEILLGFERSLQSLSSELDRKKPTLQIQGSELIFDKDCNDVLLGSLGHLVRNSVFHGFQSEDEEAGRIMVEARIEGSWAELSYRDSGRGLDMLQLHAKGIASGLLNVGASPEEIARVIFEANISTAPVVSQIAGRGIGLDAVKSYIEGVGGQVHLELEEGGDFRPFRLLLRFPIDRLLNRRFLNIAAAEAPLLSLVS